MTFICAVGKLTFNERVSLSGAKLIRDAIMGQVLNPRDGVKLKTAVDCFQYAQNYHPEGHLLEDVHLTKGGK